MLDTRAIMIVVVLALGWSTSATALTQDQEHCEEVEPDIAIGGCTAVINSSLYSTKDHAIAFANRGAAYHRKGQNEAAVLDLGESIRLDPNLSVTYAARGYAEVILGRNKDAEDDYNRAIALDPKNSKIYVDRGLLLLREHKPDRALPDFDAALQFDPNDADAYLGRGVGYGMKYGLDRTHPEFSERSKQNFDMYRRLQGTQKPDR